MSQTVLEFRHAQRYLRQQAWIPDWPRLPRATVYLAFFTKLTTESSNYFGTDLIGLLPRCSCCGGRYAGSRAQ